MSGDEGSGRESSSSGEETEEGDEDKDENEDGWQAIEASMEVS